MYTVCSSSHTYTHVHAHGHTHFVSILVCVLLQSKLWHTYAMKSIRAVPELENELRKREKELARVKRSEQFHSFRRTVVFFFILFSLFLFVLIVSLTSYPEAQFRLYLFLQRHNIYSVTRQRTWTEY